MCKLYNNLDINLISLSGNLVFFCVMLRRTLEQLIYPHHSTYRYNSLDNLAKSSCTLLIVFMIQTHKRWRQ